MKVLRIHSFVLLSLLYMTSGTLLAQTVPTDAADVQPILIGAQIPDVTIKTAEGSDVQLREVVAQKPTVLIFYRGGWCPFCNRHMAELNSIQGDLVEEGYQVIAISPDKPEKLQQSVAQHSLSYTLYSDSPMQASKEFGIAFKVDERTVLRYKQTGLDIEGDSGYNHHMLPVPSVFLINQQGIVNFKYVNPDYRERLKSDVLIAAARAYK